MVYNANVSLYRNQTVALILAAGVGRRLAAAHEGPKVLLDMGGRSLLQRRLESLVACGIGRVSITVGHAAERIRAEVGRLAPPMEVRLVENPRYCEGSLVSLAVQAEALEGGGGVLVMDGDVLHDSRMITRLLEGDPARARLLMDPALEPGDEPVKVCLRGGRIVDFRKVPADPGERHGESVGFFRFPPGMARALSDRCRARLDAGGAALEYEEAIRDLILQRPDEFEVAEVGDLPWTEIDFEADVARARDHILPDLVD